MVVNKALITPAGKHGGGERGGIAALNLTMTKDFVCQPEENDKMRLPCLVVMPLRLLCFGHHEKMRSYVTCSATVALCFPNHGQTPDGWGFLGEKHLELPGLPFPDGSVS